MKTDRKTTNSIIRLVKEKMADNIRRDLKSQGKVEFIKNGWLKNIKDNVLKEYETDKEIITTILSGNTNPKKIQDLHQTQSSTILTYNCFSLFKECTRVLELPVAGSFCSLRTDFAELEMPFNTGVRGGQPQLDIVFAENEHGHNIKVLAIESKFTEYFKYEPPEFSCCYEKKFKGRGYFDEMKRVQENPNEYMCLDVAQLIKHSFGIVEKYGNENVLLLYLYWEPHTNNNTDQSIVNLIRGHKMDLMKFKQRVSSCKPAFQQMSYNDLWEHWLKSDDSEIRNYAKKLKNRYLIEI